MIVGRITTKSQTTVPLAVRRALGLAPGDEMAWAIEDGRVLVTKVSEDDGDRSADFAMFTEWADDLDSAYDDL